ncbi:PD-(D/E)XK motif protein [Asaia sp. BMEF1]|uniref:PD-(D/E)XK motif protein n=1 Tax=Asaia sp. BMEF1 TaxID=3155932 RepID=UPI003F67C48C
MTPADLIERWADLALARHSMSGMDRRRLEAQAPVDVFACVFWPRGRSGLLVEGDGHVADLAERVPRCRGVRVVLEEHGGSSQPERTKLAIVLEEERLREIFAVLSADLVNAIVTEPSSAVALRRCIDRLCMWRGLFDRIAPEGLSEERQRGLFGELIVLDHLFLVAGNLLDGVAAWIGSDSAHQDFRRGGLAIEVKTSLAKRHTKIMISNEKQLDERLHDTLVLASIRLDESEPHGLSLPDLVAQLRLRLAGDEPATRLFDERLLLANYLDVHAPLYEVRRYRVTSTQWFRVEGQFPRLTEVNLPAGVGDIHYSIIADDLGAWEMDEETVHDMAGGGA